MTYIFYIVSFQADKSMIGYLHTEMKKLLFLFLARFVSTMVIRATTDITNLDFKATNNQLTEEAGMANNMDSPSEKIYYFFK